MRYISTIALNGILAHSPKDHKRLLWHINAIVSCPQVLCVRSIRDVPRQFCLWGRAFKKKWRTFIEFAANLTLPVHIKVPLLHHQHFWSFTDIGLNLLWPTITNQIYKLHYCTKKRKHSFRLTVLSVCEKNVSAFSCKSEVLQYQQIIQIYKQQVENLSSVLMQVKAPAA